ncbi:MAG: L-idonate 5-dehydrogenase [Acetobacteraceae bacterium]
MKAAIIHAAHDLRIGAADPVEPGPGEVQVRIRAGGICGSDLHYYQHGGFGTVRLREPLIPGHEIAGEVLTTGPGVSRVRPGDRVAVNPSRPCLHCDYCLAGQPRHCLDMRFFGSAMRFPHVQGGFRESLVCREDQAVPVPAGLPLERAVFPSRCPSACTLRLRPNRCWAKRILVTGTGPIGALAVLVARHAGAREVVVTDLADAPLAIARRIGADLAINVRSDPAGLERFGRDKGTFDVVLEASGSGAALASALAVARPGAVLVQLGLGGDMTLPINTIVAKEIQLRGTFRFDREFEWAVQFLATGAIDVAPLLTEIVPLDEAVRAFELAGDRSRAMKVQLAL